MSERDVRAIDEVLIDAREVLMSLMALRRHHAVAALAALSAQVDALQDELDDAADEVLRGD